MVPFSVLTEAGDPSSQPTFDGLPADLSLTVECRSVALPTDGDMPPSFLLVVAALDGCCPPFERVIEGGETRLGRAQVVEALRQRTACFRRRHGLEGFQIAVQLPDDGADLFEGRPLVVVEADELCQHLLGVDPAERVDEHVELAGVVADDHQLRSAFANGGGATAVYCTNDNR